MPVGQHVAVGADDEPGPVVIAPAQRHRDQPHRALILLRQAGEISRPDRPDLGVKGGGLGLGRGHRAPQAVDQPLRGCPALRSGQLLAHALQVPLGLLPSRFPYRQLLAQGVLCPIQGRLQLRGPRLGRFELAPEEIHLCRGRRRRTGLGQLPAQALTFGASRIFRGAERPLGVLDLPREEPVDAIDTATEQEHKRDHQSGEPPHLAPGVLADLLGDGPHEVRRPPSLGERLSNQSNHGALAEPSCSPPSHPGLGPWHRL